MKIKLFQYILPHLPSITRSHLRRTRHPIRQRYVRHFIRGLVRHVAHGGAVTLMVSLGDRPMDFFDSILHLRANRSPKGSASSNDERCYLKGSHRAAGLVRHAWVWTDTTVTYVAAVIRRQQRVKKHVFKVHGAGATLQLQYEFFFWIMVMRKVDSGVSMRS